jgi:phosphatidylserine decarboxylase
MEDWKKCVEDLKNIINKRPDLKNALQASIHKAGYADTQTLDNYYDFLQDLLSVIPTQRAMSPAAIKFHYLISQSPGDVLKKDKLFLDWLVSFSRNLGAFLDTPESASCLQGFINDPSYQIEDYYQNPSGWLTFNQFFARHVKPGKRPVAEICNDRIIVSPTDSIYRGSWPIDNNSSIRAKGTDYSIPQLLEGSPYANAFEGGMFTHSYLDTTDYHRYHTPVGGTIKEIRKIPGNVVVKAIKKEDGEITTIDETGFQFTQTRGLVIIESSIGLVAVLPIGMGHVSSVNFTTDEAVSLVKGEEFGYFSYGGSDIVMLFEKGKVEFTAQCDSHYKQGEKIAQAI